jgi:hypothetical protein
MNIHMNELHAIGICDNMCAQAQRISFAWEPPLKRNGVWWFYYISITETQVMISIEIYAFNKVTSIHGC